MRKLGYIALALLLAGMAGVILHSCQRNRQLEAELRGPITAAEQQLAGETIIATAAKLQVDAKEVEAVGQKTLALAMDRVTQHRVTQTTTFYLVEFQKQQGKHYIPVAYTQLASGSVRNQDVYVRPNDQQQIPGGRIVWKVRDFQPKVVPEFSKVFTFDLYMIEVDGQEIYGLMKSRDTERFSPERTAPWVDLPVSGDVVVEKTVYLQPGQKSEPLVYEVRGNIIYKTSITPPQPYTLWVGGEIINVGVDNAKTPLISDRAVIQVQLPDTAQRNATIHFVVFDK